MSQREQLSPNYDKLDVALRSLGYSIEAAVADVVDNSLDAKAKSILIRILLKPNEPMGIAIIDDGTGMSSDILKEAMRFGADVSQEIHRLGKFGLGLKLASLSQSKELKVFSLQKGSLVGRAWLEDGIRNQFSSEIYTEDECRLAVGAVSPEFLKKTSGTMVVWSNLYRMGNYQREPEKHAQKLLTKLKKHLSLVFHRYLSGKPQKVAINLDVYDVATKSCGLPEEIEALDPFGYKITGHSDFPAKLDLDGEYAGRLSMRAHVWPANSDSPNYKLPGGANSRQGFYFYRNNRLIQAGGWNGTREAEPHASLVRLEVELDASFDLEIGLDVKKVEIQLPTTLVAAIQTSSNKDGLTFKKYLSIADKAYRTRQVTDSELPLIPSIGLPSKLSQFLHDELRIKATAKHRDLTIYWSDLDDDSFFDFDRDKEILYLNKKFRNKLLHGLSGSSADIPVVKCLLFLLLRDAITSQRMGSKAREQTEQLNRILVEAVKYERSHDA